ncbi:hypothetical protein RhiirA5_436474 [Rhizophagus irregularis]|uniref:Uncharacterized protein n=1 Tax=Rhizophagus irregularis TaxID=588596 RepID=A0A2N0NLZ3_9GLOM|nr:hypothetical protein RhiirA5_436474 [Rhizophagus irregularis]
MKNNNNNNKKFFKIDGKKIPLEEFKVEQLERLIFYKGMFEDSNIINLWQVNIDKNRYKPMKEKNISIIAVIAITSTADSFQKDITRAKAPNGSVWSGL